MEVHYSEPSVAFEGGAGQGGIGPFLLKLGVTISLANHLAGTRPRTCSVAMPGQELEEASVKGLHETSLLRELLFQLSTCTFVNYFGTEIPCTPPVEGVSFNKVSPHWRCYS